MLYKYILFYLNNININNLFLKEKKNKNNKKLIIFKK